MTSLSLVRRLTGGVDATPPSNADLTTIVRLPMVDGRHEDEAIITADYGGRGIGAAPAKALAEAGADVAITYVSDRRPRTAWSLRLA